MLRIIFGVAAIVVDASHQPGAQQQLMAMNCLVAAKKSYIGVYPVPHLEMFKCLVDHSHGYAIAD
jgi:hypothetical protein